MMFRPELFAVAMSVGEIASASSTPPAWSAWSVAVSSPNGLNVIWSTWAALGVSQ